MPRTLTVLVAAFLAAAFPMAQSAGTPPDNAVFAIAYVEVVAAERAKAVAALKQYRDAGLKENTSVVVLEQMGRPGHFVMVEQLADQNGFDTRAAAPRVKQLHSTLDSIRASHFDERPYRRFAVAAAPPPAPTAQNVFVVTHVDIAPTAKGDAPGLLKQLVQDSRQEPGNLRVGVLQHAMRGNHFTVVEAWRTEQAREAHAAAAHTRRYREQIGPLTGSPLDERLFRLIE